MGNEVSNLDVTEALVSDDLIALENIELILAQEEEKNHEPSLKREGILIDAVAIQDEEISTVPDNIKILRPSKINNKKKASDTLFSKYGNDVFNLMKLENEDDFLDEEQLKELVNDRLKEIDQLAKKVGEKVVNVIHFAAGNSVLSSYTKIAIKLLQGNEKVSRMDIRQAYLDYPYKVGTANAQASQMMKLLPALGIANREGTSLVANPESKLLPIL